MESIALYRKYRPEKLKDVLGQGHVVKVLEGALKEKHTAHAYLFTGSRGIGKTSVARILARELGTSDKDLYEIDAASNRGIDDVRELREAVRTLPFESDYKVYIVDEVHMLTKEAFNALLKTLEEPPAHAVFILATTELDKVPDTVVSRCEVHYFKQPTRDVLKKHMIAIAKKEGFTLDAGAADLIGLLSEGSFRDAQGILQKILSSSEDTKVSLEEVELVTGAPKGALVNDIVEALSTHEVKKGLEAVHEAAERNIDMQVFMKLILAKVRGVLLMRYAPHMKGVLAEEFAPDDITFLDTHAQDTDSKITSRTLKTLLEAQQDMKFAQSAHMPLEIALIELSGEVGEGTGKLFS